MDAISEWVHLIQTHLTEDLLLPKFKGGSSTLAGHCYVASETLYHLLNEQCPEHGFKPASGRDGAGNVHWWLEDAAGRRLDPTAGQYRTPPYSNGQRRGFLTKNLSKRGKVLYARVVNDLKYNPVITKPLSV